MIPTATSLLAVVLTLTGSAAGSEAPPRALPADDIAVPFAVGERLDYDVKFGPLRVGSGSMEVAGIEQVRGHRAWHTVFTVKGGTFFYRVNDRLQSWMDTQSLSSLRFEQQIDEGSYERQRVYDIYPDRSMFIEQGKAPRPSVSQPLDDGSFLYFLRTIPLDVGQTYTFNRYFVPDRNPVVIHVLRRERISVPAGTFDAVVIQPVIRTKGIFSEDGHAEVWLSDDSRRIMLQMKSKLSFGSLNLYLKSYRLTTPDAANGTSAK